ncbi:MAG: hypothetical protein LBO04_05435 [Spirochaetaceae bacterium]|jgi:hypothetical protein|nr:hypothetical protein [Spirochaetaceae bacterium]
MKKHIIIFVLSITNAVLSFSGEQGGNIYTFIVNIVNDQFRLPLVGLVNIARGDHSTLHAGLANRNEGDFTGLQAGLVNTVDGAVDGVQNGLVNTAKQLDGVQAGLFNYAESAKNGLPVGLVSIVKYGGYRAVELSVNETAPVNIALKTGVPQLYTSIIFSYNPFEENVRDQIFLGAGLGSIITIDEPFFFNPEITTSGKVAGRSQFYTSFVPYFGFDLTPDTSVLAGPSLLWTHSLKNENSAAPFFKMLECKIGERNSLFLGGKIAVRLRW